MSLLVLVLLSLGAAPAQADAIDDDVQSRQSPSPGFSLDELRSKYATVQDRYVTVHGVEIAYRDEGTGPVILLIHGSSSNLRSLDSLADHLTDRFRVIRYDVPPFGLSGPVHEVDLAGVDPSDVPASLLDELGVRKATVIGMSFGGSIALNLASRHPNLVERLIISNSPSDPIGSDVSVGPSFAAALAKYGDDADRPRPFEYWRTNLEYYYGEPHRLSRETVQIATDFDRGLPPRNVLSLISKTADNKAVREAYAKVEAPVLLLWGGRDPMLPAPTAERLATYLPKAEISKIIMPDVGHYPAMEVPRRYAALATAYITMANPVEPVSPPPIER